MRLTRVLIFVAMLMTLAVSCGDRVNEVTVIAQDQECRDAVEFRWWVKKNYPLVWQEYYGGTACGRDSV